MKRAIFLDRDGVINIDKGYVSKIEDFKFIDGVIKSLKKLQNAGFLLIIITNQSGIGRGYYSLEDFEKLTNWMLEELKKSGVFIEKVYFCPHSPDENCECRKPSSGMIKEALKEFNIDPKNSWMVGDKQSDILAAFGAGVLNFIYVGDEKITQNVHFFSSLKDGLGEILKDLKWFVCLIAKPYQMQI